jgi:hypothetical protein
MRAMNTVEMANHVKPGQLWIDNDPRNTDKGKTGRAKAKYRTVKIIALPSLSSPGVMEVVKCPLRPDTIGKLKRFTYAKLIDNYSRAV